MLIHSLLVDLFYIFFFFYMYIFFSLFVLVFFFYFDFFFFFLIFFFFFLFFFFFQAEDGIRDLTVTGVQTCALPISSHKKPTKALPSGNSASVIHISNGN